MLVCENLSLKINEKTIFSNLSFSCFRGCFLYLKGKNGSGKTSLLRMIAGIQKFDSSNKCDSEYYLPGSKENQNLKTKQHNSHAKILINSISIDAIEKPFSLYIGHKNGMRMEMSVMDNLIFWTKIYNSELMLIAAIHYWKLNDILDEKCYKLSAGNMRKVSLARLMCCSSDLWLLDEVDVNLDEGNRELLFNAIKIKIENGGIVLFSSHYNTKGKPAIDLDYF